MKKPFGVRNWVLLCVTSSLGGLYAGGCFGIPLGLLAKPIDDGVNWAPTSASGLLCEVYDMRLDQICVILWE